MNTAGLVTWTLVTMAILMAGMGIALQDQAAALTASYASLAGILASPFQRRLPKETP